MTDLLIRSARVLTDDEAGAHGGRWGVIQDDVSGLIERWLGPAVREAESLELGPCDAAANEGLIATGEPKVSALLYTGLPKGVSRTGLLALIQHDTRDDDGQPCNLLASAFPFLGEGVEVEASVKRISLHPNRLEAVLTLATIAGPNIWVFDPLFFQGRSLYREGEVYRFSVAALAYRMAPPSTREFTIDNPLEIRKFHARGAWANAHGGWSKDDEEAAMATWQPESPEDLEPIRFRMDEMAALLPNSNGPVDDAEFPGQVVRVVPRAVRILDMDFWRIDTVVIRPDDEAFILPIYVAERLFDGDWRPAVGEYVAGTLWMQGYAVARVGGMQ